MNVAFNLRVLMVELQDRDLEVQGSIPCPGLNFLFKAESLFNIICLNDSAFSSNSKVSNIPHELCWPPF